MNNSNLNIVIDTRNQHPYGVNRRIQFFAHHAGVKLVENLNFSGANFVKYAVVKG
jgi:hypothetical protein